MIRSSGTRLTPLARLHRAIDSAVAERTLPTRRRRVQWTITAPAFIPAVKRETWSLHVQVAERGDDNARSALAAEYAGNAQQLARRFYRHREPLEDLVQVAMEALVIAIDRFDPNRGTPFLGYANPTIAGTLKRYYRDAGWSIRLPRRVHELSGPTREAADMLYRDLGRQATTAEVADLLDVPESDVKEALHATSSRAVASIDEPIDADGDSRHEVAVVDTGYRRVEELSSLHRAIGVLDREQQHIISRYFNDSLTQAEIAREIGRSQIHVSRSLAVSLRRLRQQL